MVQLKLNGNKTNEHGVDYNASNILLLLQQAGRTDVHPDYRISLTGNTQL